VCLNLTSLPLQRFWEDEKVSQPLPSTKEEEQCERHFVATYDRSPQGRYIVRLSFKNATPLDIGDSLFIAQSLYEKLEKRLRSRSDIGDQYHAFLDEYRSLRHMHRVE